jgi:sterol desaturase/sphingolipid hydroxylase (fatty acid hydroxylase superfamily)
MMAVSLKYDRLYFTAVMACAHSAPVVVGFVLFTAVEALPSLDRYKLQPFQRTNRISSLIRRFCFSGTEEERDFREKRKTNESSFWWCLADCLVNHLIVVPTIFMGPVYTVAARLFPSLLEFSAPLPSRWSVVAQILWFTIVEDFLFYWTHRFLHSRWLYSRVHKVHHVFRSPVVISAEYAHIVEKVLGNHVPVAVGPLTWPAHPYVLALWVAVRMSKTVEAHSGYMFPFSPFSFAPAIQTTSERHDWHHSHNDGVYGSFYRLWDWAGGTEASFLKHKEKLAGESRR